MGLNLVITLRNIYILNPTWPYSKNSEAAVEESSLQLSSHGTPLVWWPPSGQSVHQIRLTNPFKSKCISRKDEWENLVYIRSNSIKICAQRGRRWLTHLFPMHPFSTPWKHQKTLQFCFQGVEKGFFGNKWVNIVKRSKIMNEVKPLQNINKNS